jgi:TP901-1 family phage major tail protein
MAGQRGRDILLKVSDGNISPGFVGVAGLRVRKIALGAGLVDATSADSPDGWRELLSGAGTRAAQISGSGVFKDAASDALIRALFFAQSVAPWQVIVPDFGVLEGPFLVSELTYSGEHDGEAQFSIALASAGAIGFSAP